MFQALGYRNFRLYWTALLLSILGRNVEHVAQSWLVLELTHSPLMLGIAGLSHAVPNIALALIGGVIADRFNRKLLFAVTEGALALLYFYLGTLIVFGWVRVWHVLVFAFFSGCVRAVDQPTRQALLPHMVPRGEMTNAVALTNTVWQLSRLVGPAVGGMLIYLFGVASAFYAGGVSFFLALALVLGIDAVQTIMDTKRRGLLQSIGDGLDFIRRDEVFYILIGMAFFNGLFGLSYVTLMPVFARDILDVGSRGYGFLQTSGGAGAIVGTLVVATLAHSPRKGRQAITGSVVFGLLLMAFSFSSSYPLSLGLIFLGGLANEVYIVLISTILQLKLPDELRGRVMGIFGLTWSFTPLGGTLAGAIAEFAGAPAAVALGGFLVAAMGLLVALTRPGIRELRA
jgi:MFS family permease